MRNEYKSIIKISNDIVFMTDNGNVFESVVKQHKVAQSDNF